MREEYVQRWPVPAVLVSWLKEELGRAAYFAKVDPGLFPPLISKLKAGVIPITLEYAVRLERAQKASDNPFTAEQIITIAEHLELLRYVRGIDPAPPQVKFIRKNNRSYVTPISA